MDAELRRQLESGVTAAMAQASRDVMAWGKDDCALWCADIIRAVLPYDPARDFRGRYTTRNGARRALGPKGLAGALRRAARRHNWKRISPTMGRPGDVGLAWTTVEIPKRDAALVLATVICRAPGWFVGRNERGFTAVRAEEVVATWSLLDDNAPGARVGLGRIKGGVPTSAIMHEPVSTFIGLTALIAAGLGTSAATAGLIGGVFISGALSIGVSLVSSMLQPHAGTGDIGSVDTTLADTSAPQAVQVTERQALPSKRVIVGSAYVGGALFFEQVKPPYLTMGVLLNYGQISGVDKVFVSTNQLAFAGGIVPNTILTPAGVEEQPNYPNRLQASFRFGSATQLIDPLIAVDYTNIDSEFRQRGIATAVYRFHFGADQTEFTALWGQVARPSMYQVVRGVTCYDPRDPTQSLADPTTWQWTRNATLVQAYYLTQPWGGRIPTANMVWSKIAASADYDDSVMACADGTLIPKGTVDGVITLDARPSDVMQNLLTANRGRVLESSGQVWVASSQPKTPIATIHDGIIASGVKYQAAKAKRDLLNKVQVRFVSPDQDYQLVDGPILSRADLQTADAEVLPGTIALDYTQDHRRAQRLQKAYLDSARLGRTITVSVDLDLLAIVLDELLDSVVTFSSALFSLANGTYLITAVALSDDCTTLSLALTEYDATIETAWNPATDEQPFTLAPLDAS